jgi:Fe-S oxidoreductase
MKGCSELEKSEALAKKVFDISELLKDGKSKLESKEGSVICQEPCYLRVEEKRESMDVLRSVSNFIEIEAGCCGASLGYQLRNKQMAEEIREARLKSLTGAGADSIVTTCPYCLIHLRDNGGLDVKHIVNFLRN